MTRHAFRSLLFCLIAASAVLLAACSDDKDEDATPTIAPSQTVAADATGTVSPEASSTPSPTVPAPTATPTPTLTPAEPIAWSDCPSGPFDCAEYDVPLNYADPDGGSVTLALRRLPANDPNQRVGLLFVNPGGPGGSTIDILSGWARSLPSSILNRFDVILMDPRGVGHSTPIVCHDNDLIQELIGLNPYPETAEDWHPILDATTEFADGCEKAAGDLLPYVGTRNVARDLDRIREAEGEETITYFGYSYGTSIGQVYADLFPTHVRAMVLDGALDQSLSFDEINLEQIQGFEAAFQRYLAQCAAEQCIPGDPEETVRALIEQSAEAPIPSPDGDRPAGPGEILQGILAALYSKGSWFFITSGVNAALDGDGSVLLLFADSLAGRDGNQYSNQVETNVAVNCLDGDASHDLQHYIDLTDSFEAKAPFFGGAAAAYGAYCVPWPVDPDPLPTPRAAGAPPIMVIGNTGDPATPYKWAVALAHQLESGFLVTYDAEGHTAYRTGSSCIDDAVTAYLVDLTVPPEGLTCGDAGIAPAPPVP